MFILQPRESDESVITSSLRRCRPSVYTTPKAGIPLSVFPTAPQVNLSASIHTVHLMLNVSSTKTVNANFKVINLTRLGTKPEFTAPKAGTFITTRPSEQLFNKSCKALQCNAILNMNCVGLLKQNQKELAFC